MSFRIVELDATVNGPVEITGGTVDATINGQTIDVGVNVVPVISQLYSGSGSDQTLTGLRAYNSLIVIAQLFNGTISPTTYSWFRAIASDTTYGATIAQERYYQQGYWYSGNAAISGDNTITTIPLHGADQVILQPRLNNVSSGGSLQLSVLGSSESLPESHRTTAQRAASHVLSANKSHTLVTAGDTIPIPVTSRGVRVYCQFNNGGAQSAVAFNLMDTLSGVQMARWRLQTGSDMGDEFFYNGTSGQQQSNMAVQYATLPHSQNPMYLAFDAVTGANAVDLIITEDNN